MESTDQAKAPSPTNPTRDSAVDDLLGGLVEDPISLRGNDRVRVTVEASSHGHHCGAPFAEAVNSRLILRAPGGEPSRAVLRSELLAPASLARLASPRRRSGLAPFVPNSSWLALMRRLGNSPALDEFLQFVVTRYELAVGRVATVGKDGKSSSATRWSKARG